MRNIAIVDIETTGFQAAGGLIVEVGIVSLDLNTGAVLPVFESVVQEPGFCEDHRESWIFKNSDLTFEEVAAAPLLSELIPTIQAALNGIPHGHTAFNKKFDFDYLISRDLKIKQLPCIMLEATPIVKARYKNGRGGYKWPKVEEAWAHFFPDVPYIEQHRGLDDAAHEAKICYELYKMGKFKVPEIKAETVKNAITNLIFELAEAGIYELQEERSPEGYHAVAKAACDLDGLIFDYKEFS
jgi:DNA polymerase-3 subunit epsilon